ncbi:MAG: hypothetical protein RR296_12595 [Clostridia bacterium]
MGEMTGLLNRLIALCALCAATEHMKLNSWLRLMCALLAAEAIVEMLGALIAAWRGCA